LEELLINGTTDERGKVVNDKGRKWRWCARQVRKIHLKGEGELVRSDGERKRKQPSRTLHGRDDKECHTD
jgi:hypothetical protein